MDRVKEYIHERGADIRGGLEQTRRKCMWTGRDGGSSAVVIPLGDISKENEVSETKDR